MPLLLNGGVAEWLGSGLQNRARQFDSARRLFLSVFGVFRFLGVHCSRNSSGMAAESIEHPFVSSGLGLGVRSACSRVLGSSWQG